MKISQLFDQQNTSDLIILLFISGNKYNIWRLETNDMTEFAFGAQTVSQFAQRSSKCVPCTINLNHIPKPNPTNPNL